jgi:hypothetical protein
MGNATFFLSQTQYDWLAKAQPMTYFGVRAMRQTRLPTPIPSSRITGYTSPVCSGYGATLQHHAVWLRQARSVTPSGGLISVCDCLPSSQPTNRSSVNAWLRSVRNLTWVLLQFGQRQRCVPAGVLPHFCSLL